MRCSMHRCSSCARSVRVVGMTTRVIGQRAQRAAVARAEREHAHSLRARRFGRAQHVRRVAARRMDDQQVARLAPAPRPVARTSASKPKSFPAAVSSDVSVVKRDRGIRARGCACSARRTPSPCAARRPRCRRCRRRTACRRARTVSRTMSSARSRSGPESSRPRACHGGQLAQSIGEVLVHVGVHGSVAPEWPAVSDLPKTISPKAANHAAPESDRPDRDRRLVRQAAVARCSNVSRSDVVLGRRRPRAASRARWRAYGDRRVLSLANTIHQPVARAVPRARPSRSVPCASRIAVTSIWITAPAVFQCHDLGRRVHPQ